MNQQYYDATVKMEKAGVNAEFIEGWQSGYVKNPPREEQRLTEAYEAGYEMGKERELGDFSAWVGK